MQDTTLADIEVLIGQSFSSLPSGSVFKKCTNNRQQTVYIVGEITFPDFYDLNLQKTCAQGIRYFLSPFAAFHFNCEQLNIQIDDHFFFFFDDGGKSWPKIFQSAQLNFSSKILLIHNIRLIECPVKNIIKI